jgi:pimeloyl-ACP methyl ester carboxylesterase
MTPREVEVDGLAASVFTGGGLPVVLVHGTMDRSSGLRRTVRHLQPATVVTFDRRGYAASLAAGISTTMQEQVSDLMAVIDVVTTGPAVVVGHSLGGLIALHAALRQPDRVVSVGVWEAPMPWEEWYRTSAARTGVVGPDEDPGDAAERFMRAMIGDRLWERLPAAFRAERRAEGPTLRADLALASSPEAELDLTAVSVPVVAGCGSESAERFRRSAATLAELVPGATYVEVTGATHGVHLSHPAEFAAFARQALERAPLAA